MGFNNPGVPWSELEKTLSGRADETKGDGHVQRSGGDSPAWSRTREPYERPPDVGRATPTTTPYAELHCHSNFSFLDGASDPEVLVEEAVRLGLGALALTDRNGFYGVVRFAEAALAYGLATVFGAELSLTDPHDEIIGSAGDLVVLARGPAGYARLGRAISEGQMAGEKGAPRYYLERLAELSGDEWVVLTGTQRGPLNAALEADGPIAAQRTLDTLIESFGRSNLVVELWDLSLIHI